MCLCERERGGERGDRDRDSDIQRHGDTETERLGLFCIQCFLFVYTTMYIGKYKFSVVIFYLTYKADFS